VEVIHDTPGRLRLAVPRIVGAKARAHACEDAVRDISGVRHVQANELTGSLLVLYTPSALTREAIRQRCAAWAGECSPPPRPAHSHSHALGRGGRMAHVVTELLPHLLPLVFGSCPICRRR
jgi:hypothetical protein